MGGQLALRLVTGLLVAGSPAVAAVELAPRPISEAEHAAVELALEYLSEGAGAWRDRLASESPWSELDGDAALREIEVRAGPPRGSAWMLRTPGPGSPADLVVFSILFPSGAEETLGLRLAKPDGGDRSWRIVEVRSLSEPSSQEGDLFFLQRRGSPPVADAVAPPADRPSPEPIPPGVTLLILSVLAFGAGSLLRLGRAPRPRPAPVVFSRLVVIGVALLFACSGPGTRRSDGEPGTEVVGGTGQPLLGGLRDLRWSLATDGDPAALSDQIQRIAPEGLLHQVAELWRAQLLLRQVDLRQAEAILAELPEPGPVPLADLLRARLATTRGDKETASWAYDQVRSVGPDHDGLRFEIATALATLGFERQAEIEAIQIAEMGSRDAQAWYLRARLLLLDEKPEKGVEVLRTAWSQQPVPRAELFDDPLLATLTARPKMFRVIAPSSPEEPTVEPADLGREAVKLPPEARTSLLGRLLRIELGGAGADDGTGAAVGVTVLEVPGGSKLAPLDAHLANAAEWEEREQGAALTRLDALSAEAASLTAFGVPRLRRQLLEAAAALALQNRWDELVLLTDGIDDHVSRVPPILVQLRARALRQTSRIGEARELLIQLATTAMESKRPAPGVLYQLAELFVSDQEYDVALRLLRKAAALSPLARNESRMQQIRLEKWLYESPKRHWSDHFEVVYPKETGETYPDQLAAVLEAERERIGHWVPLRPGFPIEVDLFPLERFVRAHSGGMLVLGLYDGRVRVPFADLRSLHPRLVSILSHEVAHALIGQATFDQAPAWFQEGLAQHVEMLPGRVNPIPDLHRTDRVIAFPLIEPILDGFAEPQLVDLAYAEAAWVVHYLESVHGVRSLHGLVRAFSRGLTTEQAVEEVLGLSVAELDRKVWSWCLKEAPDVWPTQLVRYDQEFDGLVQRSDSPDRVAREARSRAGRLATPGREPLDARPTLRSWHAAYAERVAPFKRSLGGILGRLRRGESPQPIACVTLSGQVNRILTDDVALHPPDDAVARPLETAFRHFAVMAEACSSGDVKDAQRAMMMAERALGQAAEAMKRHGLRP